MCDLFSPRSRIPYHCIRATLASGVEATTTDDATVAGNLNKAKQEIIGVISSTNSASP
jgi:hypothetical protein